MHKCVRTYVYVCIFDMRRADSVHVLYMRAVDFQQRADTDALEVYCWFWLQFQTRHSWKPWNRPQDYRGSLRSLFGIKCIIGLLFACRVITLKFTEWTNSWPKISYTLYWKSGPSVFKYGPLFCYKESTETRKWKYGTFIEPIFHKL